ncbi:RNA replication protein [Dirofilaria immitis]
MESSWWGKKYTPKSCFGSQENKFNPSPTSKLEKPMPQSDGWEGCPRCGLIVFVGWLGSFSGSVVNIQAMDKSKTKDHSKIKVAEETATTSKSSGANVAKDTNKVNSFSPTIQNHNNVQIMNYNCRTDGRKSGIDIRKIPISGITTDVITKTIVNDATKKTGNLRDHKAKNGSDNKGLTKPLDSLVVSNQPMQKSWQAAVAGAKEYQQYHGQIVTHMLQNGYSPTYVQVRISLYAEIKVMVLQLMYNSGYFATFSSQQ